MKLPKLLLALTLLLSATAPFVQAQVDQTIYGDSLQNGWENWSWATIDSANTSPVHNGARSVKVTAGAYQAFWPHHGSFDTTGYVNVTFWIHGGTTGGQTMTITGLRDDAAQSPTVTLGPIAANSWQQVVVPLASLGIANVSNCTGFWLQENRGASQPAYYVDDIVLTAVAAPSAVNITVNAASVLQTIGARHFSINTAIWDNVFDTTTTINAMLEAGVKGLRFPGGSASDDYHWATGKNDAGTVTWATNFDMFAHVATSVGAAPAVFITANYGSGTAQEAADWVRYSNVTKNYGFKYWEIGNENYGTWEVDRNSRPNDPITYATRFRDYYTQMKAADPTIKVGCPVVVGEDSYANYADESVVNPRTGTTHSGWTAVMLAKLKNLGVTPDFVAYHYYAQGPGTEGDAGLLASATNWTGDAANLRQQLSDYLGSAGAAVEITCTENNSVYTNPGKQTTSLVNGLFLAESFCQLLKTEFKAMVWWDWRNGKESANNNSASLYGWRNYGDYGVLDASVPSLPASRYPTYYAFKLLKYFARPGDQVVATTSNYVGISAHAVKHPDGSLSVLLINKHPSSAVSVNVSLSGYSPPANAAVATYGKAQDTAAQTGSGSADIAQSSISIPGANFTFGAAPYSLNSISFAPSGTQPQPPPAPSNLTSSGLTANQVTLSWKDNSNNETSFVLERATNAAFTAGLVANSLNSNVTTFQATGLTRNTNYYFRVRAINANGASPNSNSVSVRTKAK